MIDIQIVWLLTIVLGAVTITVALKRQSNSAWQDERVTFQLRNEIDSLRNEVNGLRVSNSMMLKQLSDQDAIIHRLETSFEAVENENKLLRRRFAELGLNEK